VFLAIINTYEVGSSVTVTGTFSNKLTGEPVDPSEANVDIYDPTNTVTSYKYDGGTGDVVRVSMGVYSYDIDTTDLPGQWQYRWWSPPTVQTAGAWSFIVTPWPVV
jgi:hypothetical protein